LDIKLKTKMFQKARIKLTAWYLLIITIVCFTLSGVIFRIQMSEFNRFAKAQRNRIERQFPPEILLPPKPPTIDPDLIAETQKRILFNLMMLNGVIIVFSGCFGYLLAGKTLKPIKEALDEQDRFISDSSHELRTPLTSLKSAMEVALMDKKLTLSEAKKLIKENIEDVNRLQNLSDSLIKLSKNKEQKNNLNFEEISLSKLISSSIEKIKPQAEHKGVIIKKKIQTCNIKGDQEKLQSLLAILLDNAIKYSPSKKTIQIKTFISGNDITISITDHGQGISKKDIPFIFDRFYRADVSRTGSTTPGFGLGLSIAKMIVENHHGSIKVESHLGKGSSFTVTLPKIFS
jgi:two-component system, OmpR family, sensor histidine kinase CiaH